MQGNWKAYFSFPFLSLIASGVVFLGLTGFASIGSGGLRLPGEHAAFVVLAVVFSILLILGQLDCSLFESTVGFRVGKLLHLTQRDNQDLVYEQQVKGNIAKGTETIDVALTILWIVILVVGG